MECAREGLFVVHFSISQLGRDYQFFLLSLLCHFGSAAFGMHGTLLRAWEKFHKHVSKGTEYIARFDDSVLCLSNGPNSYHILPITCSCVPVMFS